MKLKVNASYRGLLTHDVVRVGETETKKYQFYNTLSKYSVKVRKASRILK